MEKSDEAHPVTVNDIIRCLSAYDISAERKSIYTDIQLLSDFGIDIICEKGRSNHYYIGKRDFELAELKLLVDAVQSSKFITHKKSNELIKKIETLTSSHEAKELHRQDPVNVELEFDNSLINVVIDPETVKGRMKEHLESVMEMYEQ
jgi:predicted DNA-binding transcriptional regulator YafY